MNEKERKLYLKIKQNPNHELFDMLFEYNENDEVVPIQGMTLRLMPDGIPLILDETMAVGLNQDPFATVRTDKTFRQMSNEIALESPLGKNSIFYSEERTIINGKIPKL